MGNPSNKINFNDKPNEIEIETLLSQALPKPSFHFYKKMETALWNKTASQIRGTHLGISTLFKKWMLGFGIFTLFLFIFGISFFPSIRAIAHQIAYSFFSSPSNRIDVQVTLSANEDLFHFSDQANFTQTIVDVEEKAGYVLKVLDHRLESVIFIGARFEPYNNSVTIMYQGTDFKLFLTQRLIENVKDIFSIGSNAQIQLVNIGDLQGEFVIGGWKAISTQTASKKGTPLSQTNINAVWDSNLPQYTLRWQENGFTYELRALGEGSPTQSDLIAYAIGIK
jgi:hypothetical protein